MRKFNVKHLLLFGTGLFHLLAFGFIFICWQTGVLPKLYDSETVETYYFIVLMSFAGVAYALDTKHRKKPCYLVLFAIPLYAMIYTLLAQMSVDFYSIQTILVVFVFGCVFLFGHYCYKYLMPKMMQVKHLYNIFSFLYTIIGLTIVVCVTFFIIHS